MAVCPKCGSLGKFDDHVDTDNGGTYKLYECESEGCGNWFSDEGETRFERISRLCKTEQGIYTLSREDLFYASKWVESGELEIPDELIAVFAVECVMKLE